MPRFFKTTLAVAAVLTIAGCGSDMDVTDAVHLYIRDAVTGEPRAYDATVTARDGDYEEVVRLRDTAPNAPDYEATALVVFIGTGRTGTYSITVSHPGYHDWHQDDIVVREGRRSRFDGSRLPETVQLDVNLQPVE